MVKITKNIVEKDSKVIQIKKYKKKLNLKKEILKVKKVE